MRLTSLLLLLACGDTQSNDARDATPLQTEASFSAPSSGAWPLTQGNHWRFVDRDVTVKSASNTTAIVDGLFAASRTLSYDANADALRLWTPGLDAWEPLVRFDAAVGDSWEMRIDDGPCGRYLATVTEANVVSKAIAGAFIGARTVSYVMEPDMNVRCVKPAFDTLTVVPGFGPVAVGKNTLIDAGVDGALYPVARRLTLAEVTANAADIGEQPFVLQADVTAGHPACTDRYCKMGCCNICATHFVAGTMTLRALAPTPFGCVGNECNPTQTCEPLALDTHYELTGRLRATDAGGYEFVVVNY